MSDRLRKAGRILQTYPNLNGSYGVPDFKNVSIVGHYVKDRTKDAQFIIIRLAAIFEVLLKDITFAQALLCIMFFFLNLQP